MNPTSSQPGKKLKQKLASSSRHEFQRVCYDILNEIYPDLVYAKELGTIDTFGIDLYTLNLENESIELAFQCKGYELPEFNSNQLDQCLKSIKSLQQSSIRATSFYIIVNRYIKQADYRNSLGKALKELVDSGKANYAEFLDLNGFVRFVFNQIDIQLHGYIQEANKRFREDYIRRMDQKFYRYNVPFSLSNQRTIDFNPTAYIKKAISKANNRHYKLAQEQNKNPDKLPQKTVWSFIVSEFGFGKTSLLLNLFFTQDHIKDSMVMYLPIAQFGNDAFTNETVLCSNIFEVILDQEYNEDSEYNKIINYNLRSMLRSQKDIVLMFDGIDEHQISFTRLGLRQLFDCLRNFQSTCLFSVRKEFWDERQGDLEHAIGRTRYYKDVIILEEWRDKDIIEFIDEHCRYIHSQSDSHKLRELMQLAVDSKYEQYYGDIPKRPLFLKMLIEDVINGQIEKKKLSQIYENYLIFKFDRDRQTSIAYPKSERPLEIKGDIYAINQKIFTILAKTSRFMLRSSDDEIIPMSDISEEKLTEAIKYANIRLDDILQLLLHSVLVPFSKRSLHGFRVKFAHKSFQEFFTAFYFFQLLQRPIIDDDDISLLIQYKFSNGIENFIIGMIDNAKQHEDQFKNCISTLKDLAKNNPTDYSLAAVLMKKFEIKFDL